MSALVRRLAAGALGLLLAGGASGYTFNARSGASNDGRLEWPGGAMTWQFNSSTSDALPNVQDGSDPRAVIISAFDKWEAESAFDFTQGADSANTSAAGDGINLITFVDTPANRTAVGGALAVCVFGFDTVNNNLTRADIVFHPDITWTTTGAPGSATPIAGVALHEIGHLTGLAHSAVWGATMYPFSGAHDLSGNSELIPASVSPDDRAGINVSYPDPVFQAATGRITGLVTEGGANVYGAHVVAVNTSTGVVMGANITLGSGQAGTGRHGRYEIAGLPPGTYQVYVEPIDSPIGFANWQTTYSDGWFTSSANGGQTFDATFLTKVGSAGTVVAAGGSATVDIAVTNGTPAINITAFGLGAAGCNGFSGLGGLPVAVAAGGTRNLSIQAPGMINGSTVAVSDPSITLTGCSGFFAGADPPIFLFRVNVPAGARPGPRTIWVTLPGGEIAACTGCLEIEGPETETGLCSDTIDNDGDGLTDGADIECNVDGCPADPLKTAPGQCGCGVPDTDTDGDGTADCVDGCPADATKIAAGQCGCGVADTDGDGDGTANCNDGCPSDAGKTAPGACGCGVADTDSDGDGTPNCNDGCPNDAAKTSPGTCGCGVADTDSDGDGTPNCNDGCPNDAGKTSAGTCGCGVADTDSDGDGTPNCNDGCPNNAPKTAPGQCGCAVADTDSDGDGTANCNDGCPNNAPKIAPGQCGCATADTDSDGDGTANCVDGCPSDPAKTSAGTCGCGIAETDTDGDGTKDCVDGCPNDATKTSAGACGCGIADTDSDGDGTPNCIDNCPSTPNADQADLNGNGLGDACETVSLRLETVHAAFGATNVEVRLFVEADETICSSRVKLRMTYDGSALTVVSLAEAANCNGTLTPQSANVLDIELTCSPGFPGEGVIGTLKFNMPASGTETRYPLAISLPEADDCEVPVNALTPGSSDGAILVGCVLGDVYRGSGSAGVVNTADFVIARRMALGTVTETAVDQACGDVHPGVVTCARTGGQPSNFCVTGDADIKSGDVIVLRRKLNLVYQFDCAACTTQLGRHAGLRLAGDIAPGAGDGVVGIADVVRALRVAVGLESAAGESLLRGDVAPARREADGLLAATGDGVISVGDAVLMLRASVELERLAWPERAIGVVLEGDAPAVAWRAEVSGWPEWAEASGFEGPGCDDMSGLDAAGPTWASVCGLPGDIPGPHSATWRYRAPEPVSLVVLSGVGERVTDDLVTSSAPVLILP